MATKDDATWFRDNPRRQHRLRPLIPGEFGFTERPVRRALTRWVVVRQTRPGVRVRLSFAMHGSPAFTERAAAAVFDYCMNVGGAAIFGGRGNA